MLEIKEVPFDSLPIWYRQFVIALIHLRENKGQEVNSTYHWLLGYMASLWFTNVITAKENRVLHNLVVNARDWANKGGNICGQY